MAGQRIELSGGTTIVNIVFNAEQFLRPGSVDGFVVEVNSGDGLQAPQPTQFPPQIIL